MAPRKNSKKIEMFQEFHVNDLVLGKIKGHAPWPAKVSYGFHFHLLCQCALNFVIFVYVLFSDNSQRKE